MPGLWGAAAALFAALAIWGQHPGRRLVHLIAKPLATAAIIGAAATVAPPGPLTLWLLGGLGLSLVGDALLMFESAFLPGLAAFLAALVLYSIGFSQGAPAAPLHAALPCLGALLVLRWLWPELGKLRLPVAAYVAALVLMVWRALARSGAPTTSLAAAVSLGAGALLFMLGDTLLAARRFRKRPAPYALELGSYYLAQWCIAMSAWL